VLKISFLSQEMNTESSVVNSWSLYQLCCPISIDEKAKVTDLRSMKNQYIDSDKLYFFGGHTPQDVLFMHILSSSFVS
jgi:hypothetical protein